MTYRLAVLGGGKMGTALVQGLLSSGWATPDELLVTEILSHRRDTLSEELFGVDVLGSLDGVGIGAAVIAVKPGDVATARKRHQAGDGASCRSPRCARASWSGPAPRCARGAGDAQHARARQRVPRRSRPVRPPREDDLAWAEEILRAVGTVVRVPETALGAVTGLSGSGPAYLFLVAEGDDRRRCPCGPRPRRQHRAGAAAVRRIGGSSPTATTRRRCCGRT
mgnify:CR=1 FL=1